MYKNFHKHTRNLATILIVLLFSASLWQLAAANWIQGKAIVAQHLLNSSWNKTLESSIPIDADQLVIHKPWPWADTWPVAKLIVPQYDIEQIILAGDSGSSLAFGPGYSLASAAPNTSGTSMISGHRDTHFSFLKMLKLNDTLLIQTANNTTSYQIYDMQVVDSNIFTLPQNTDEQTLVLVTCYPFDALTAGGSSRYLVYASEIAAEINYSSPVSERKIAL